MPESGETHSTAELGLSRRRFLAAGAGVVAGAGIASLAGAGPARAGLNNLAPANAHKIVQITGPTYTDKWAAEYVDLGIPVQLSDGSLLLIGGDTYSGGDPGVPANDWRCPTGLRADTGGPGGAVQVTGAVEDRPGHAKGLVNEDHANGTTAIPSDIFRVGDTLYMHLMRGPIYDTHHTDFWKSTDNGETWTYLRQWPRDLFNYQFQQKTYAADTDDDYVYCMSTIFNRSLDSDLLLFRVLKSDLDKTDADAAASGWGPKYAYQGWGFANGAWAWGNEPTRITDRRLWGEICFRAMGGKYVLSWFQPNRDQTFADIRAQVFPLPTSDLFAGTEQTMVYASEGNPASGGPGSPAVQANLYGGFIFPGSTFDNFNIAVSNWDPNGGYAPGNTSNYVISQWQTALNPDI